jgi:hypothetical protein
MMPTFAPILLLCFGTFLVKNELASRAHAFQSNSAFVPRSSSSSSYSSSWSTRSTAVLSMVADNAKVILVTGSSRGLGKSIALALGQEQQKLVINYVSPTSQAAADETVNEIKALGGDAIAVQADSTLCSTIIMDCRSFFWHVDMISRFFFPHKLGRLWCLSPIKSNILFFFSLFSIQS